VTAVLTIAGYGLREALRRKVFGVVLILTVGFLTLFWLGVHFLYGNLGNVGPPVGVDARTFVGATVFGLAATPSEDCCSRSSSGRSAARRCCSRAGSARSRSARRTWESSTPRRC